MDVQPICISIHNMMLKYYIYKTNNPFGIQQDFLDWGLACDKVSTYTGIHGHRPLSMLQAEFKPVAQCYSGQGPQVAKLHQTSLSISWDYISFCSWEKVSSNVFRWWISCWRWCLMPCCCYQQLKAVWCAPLYPDWTGRGSVHACVLWEASPLRNECPAGRRAGGLDEARIALEGVSSFAFGAHAWP
jgi:hypothetical protein